MSTNLGTGGGGGNEPPIDFIPGEGDGDGGLIPPIEVIPGDGDGSGSGGSELPHIIYDGDYIDSNHQLEPRVQIEPAAPIPNKIATWGWVTENYPHFLKFRSNNSYYSLYKGIKKTDAEDYYFLDNTVFANKTNKRILLETDVVPKRARGFNGVATVCNKSINQRYGLIAGHFTECNGFPAPKLAVIDVTTNPGLYLEDFYENIGSGPTGDIFAIEPCHSNGHNGNLSFLVGGNFTAFNGNTAYKGLVKINVSNTSFISTQLIDTSFTLGTGFNGTILSIKRHPKLADKYFVAGNFTTYRGVSAPYICLLNGDGTLNTTDFKRTNFTGPINHIMIPHDLTYNTGNNNQPIDHMYVSGNFSIVDAFGETIWDVVTISLDGLYINKVQTKQTGYAYSPLRPGGNITGTSNTGTNIYAVYGNFNTMNNTPGFGGVYVGTRYDSSKDNTKVVYNGGSVTRILTARGYVPGTNGGLGYEYKRTFVFGSFSSFSVMVNGTYPQNIATWYYSGMHISTEPDLTGNVLTYGNPPGNGSGFNGGVTDAVLISRSGYNSNDKILAVGNFREYTHQGTTYYCNYAVLLDGANGKPDDFFLEYFDERNLNL